MIQIFLIYQRHNQINLKVSLKYQMKIICLKILQVLYNLIILIKKIFLNLNNKIKKI